MEEQRVVSPYVTRATSARKLRMEPEVANTPEITDQTGHDQQKPYITDYSRHSTASTVTRISREEKHNTSGSAGVFRNSSNVPVTELEYNVPEDKHQQPKFRENSASSECLGQEMQSAGMKYKNERNDCNYIKSVSNKLKTNYYGYSFLHPHKNRKNTSCKHIDSGYARSKDEQLTPLPVFMEAYMRLKVNANHDYSDDKNNRADCRKTITNDKKTEQTNSLEIAENYRRSLSTVEEECSASASTLKSHPMSCKTSQQQIIKSACVSPKPTNNSWNGSSPEAEAQRFFIPATYHGMMKNGNTSELNASSTESSTRPMDRSPSTQPVIIITEFEKDGKQVDSKNDKIDALKLPSITSESHLNEASDLTSHSSSIVIPCPPRDTPSPIKHAHVPASHYPVPPSPQQHVDVWASNSPLLPSPPIYTQVAARRFSVPQTYSPYFKAVTRVPSSSETVQSPQDIFYQGDASSHVFTESSIHSSGRGTVCSDFQRTECTGEEESYQRHLPNIDKATYTDYQHLTEESSLRQPEDESIPVSIKKTNPSVLPYHAFYEIHRTEDTLQTVLEVYGRNSIEMVKRSLRLFNR